MTQRRKQLSPGFTLTEILIALALISFLLVGISRIFAMTSTTISKGQGVSQALRAHRAIQQTLSNDFLGYSATGSIDLSDSNSGMVPLVIPTGTSDGAPFLAISNFRVAAYASEGEWRTALNPPAATVAAYNFAATSNAIRTYDDAGTTRIIPLNQYGFRNWRSDTIGFFTKGDFRSHSGSADSTGATAVYSSDVRSQYAFTWYGHLEVFNSNGALLAHPANGYGPPGMWNIQSGTGTEANRNNRFANQFRLGRGQFLLVEPEDSEGSNLGGADRQYKYFTIIEPSTRRPVPFIRRNWDGVEDTRDGTTLTPLNLDSVTFQYRTSTHRNDQLYSTGSPNYNDSFAASGYDTPAALGRTDIMGAGMPELRQRARHLIAIGSAWRNSLPNTWNLRLLCNPFLPQQVTRDDNGQDSPILFNSRVMGQRQNLLADSCSQFIVEYAGDFVTQNNATGAPGPMTPDGVVDFVIESGGLRQIRWYGMPRDVNGDGAIPGLGNSARLNSPDVIPLRDFAGTAFPFELVTPSAQSDYLNASVAANTNEPGGSNGNPNASSYRCVWSPTEFETPAATLTDGRELYHVPQMIRVIVEISDPKGRLDEPVTQEYVFPVKVKE